MLLDWLDCQDQSIEEVQFQLSYKLRLVHLLDTIDQYVVEFVLKSLKEVVGINILTVIMIVPFDSVSIKQNIKYKVHVTEKFILETVNKVARQTKVELFQAAPPTIILLCYEYNYKVPHLYQRCITRPGSIKKWRIRIYYYHYYYYLFYFYLQ